MPEAIRPEVKRILCPLKLERSYQIEDVEKLIRDGIESKNLKGLRMELGCCGSLHILFVLDGAWYVASGTHDMCPSCWRQDDSDDLVIENPTYLLRNVMEGLSKLRRFQNEAKARKHFARFA